MTILELAHRVVMASFVGPALPAWVEARLAAGLGSVCLFGSNVESPQQVAALTKAIHTVSEDCLIATDEEGGDVTRLHMREGSPHPGNAALGAADDVTLTFTVASSIGHELAGLGIDLNLAPVVDVNSNPLNPVIGVRSFGADPYDVARHTRAYVSGLQSAGVGACVKHFPGHGDTSIDSHLGLPKVEVSMDTLHNRELVPFAAAHEGGTVAVMTSHVLLPALDASMPVTLSTAALGMLRGEMGFNGLLVSDALDMAGASAGRGEPAAAVLALAAGCDLLCLGADKASTDLDVVVAAIVAAVESGDLAEERLTQAADRVAAAAARIADLSAGGEPPDDCASVTVASRAIEVRGELPVVRAAVVLRFVTETNIAVGNVPWGLPDDGAVLGGSDHVDVGPRSSTDELAALASGGRALVALVREPQRHEWVGDVLRRLAERRPDLVTVDMGWPGPDPLPGCAVVRTFGASRANARALDNVLAGSGPR